MTTRGIEVRRDLSWLRCPRTNADFWASSRAARPADPELTDRICADLYAYLGRPKPQLLWFDGPQSCLLAGVLAGRTRLGKPLEPRHLSPFDLASGEREPLLGNVLERQMKDDFVLSCPDVRHGELMGHGIWGGRNRCRLRNAAGEYNAR